MKNEKYKTKNPITSMMGFFVLVGANGLEPSTSCVCSRRSNQLSYVPVFW